MRNRLIIMKIKLKETLKLVSNYLKLKKLDKNISDKNKTEICSDCLVDY